MADMLSYKVILPDGREFEPISVRDTGDERTNRANVRKRMLGMTYVRVMSYDVESAVVERLPR